MLIYASVKVLVKSPNQKPLFAHDVWFTPAIVACSGIAAAMCTVIFAFRF